MVEAEDGRNPNLEKDVTKLTYKNLIKSMNLGDRFHADDRHLTDHTEGEMYMEEFEYRVFNASYSKLGAALALDIKNIHVSPGSRVLYIGDRTCGVELSYLSDIVGINGHVYVVGFDEIIEWVPDLFGCLKRRPNITLLNNVTAKYPSAYANLAGQVDVIVSDVNDIDQAEILAYNARAILTEGGCFIAFNKNPVTVHVNYHFNSAVVPNEALQMTEIQKLRERGFQLMDSLTLEPYWEGWGCIVGVLPK